jgi:hypothetical protein
LEVRPNQASNPAKTAALEGEGMSINSILVVVVSGGYTPPGMRPDRSPARYPATAIIPSRQRQTVPSTQERPSQTGSPPSSWRARAFSAVALVLACAATAFVRPRPRRTRSWSRTRCPKPAEEWDIEGAGDGTIQGFATDVSVNRGGTITFKIQTDATQYRIDIYRLGWYGGLGARKVATIQPTATLPQDQPTCITDPATGLMDCGNWDVSASWNVPADATSGLYIAKLVREDPDDGRASHIAFVVRDDDGGSALLFQTSETTWQAYNAYGGNSLYVGAAENPPVPRAHKVSFNRPYATRGGPLEDWLFNSEFPMIRWLERNGYDVSYTTDTDTDRRGADILEHKVWLSVGHDEYCSAQQRANVGAARNAGVHLAFFSGNESYWKTRWEASVDGSGTPYRTLVCYKEGTMGEVTCGGKCDPLADAWTGLWRDGCAFTPPADGCRPENALSGQISWKPGMAPITVPDTYKNFRLWRNTSIATLGTGEVATLSDSTLGYEWDYEQFPASYPAGRVTFSSTVLDGATHRLSLYRAPGGALVLGAGTVQWTWGLDGTHDRGSSTPDPRMQQMSLNVLGEMGVQPASLQAGLTQPVATGDHVPPVSTIAQPVNGASITLGTHVVISGTATDALGVVGGVDVSLDNGRTWTPAQGGGTWSFNWTPSAAGTDTIRTRSTDDLGNLETPGVGITVTIVPAPPSQCPCTIWTAAAAVGPEENDASAVDVGIKFRADVNGYVTGIRFYKQPGNVGTHVGKLWTTGGVLLGSATFINETASGWQEASLGSGITIQAGTTYVASVFMPNGHYAANEEAFSTAGEDHPPLHALANGIDGPNGVFHPGTNGDFPENTFNSTNYWVDLTFNDQATSDVTPPVVTLVSPANGSASVPAASNVEATFNEAMTAAGVNATSFQLRDGNGAQVPATVSYDAATRTATLDPTNPLDDAAFYTASLAGVTDVAGNAINSTFSWSFTTAGPPPINGPGGPILVIGSAANPFSRYFAEILRAEGFNEFAAVDIGTVTPALLAAYDVVILGEVPLTTAQATTLSDWVVAGGNLIASRPDTKLAGLLGLTPAGGNLANRYLLVNNGSGPGAGIVGQTIQYHGPADLYTVSGASVLATIYSDALSATPNPAITLRSVGSNGGQAAAFTYDLARSIVYTRQGNPAWSGQERDGVAPKRSDDLFFGNASFDPKPDWVDLDKVAIPQADEQQRMLANMILSMNLDKKPLPRFWYFPSGHKAVVVMTGDDHGDAGMAPRFDTYIAQSPAGCSLDDWECVRATGYLYVSGGFSDAQALGYKNQGFETAEHINTGCADWTETSLRANFTSQLAEFHSGLAIASMHLINLSPTRAISQLQSADFATKTP